jgi:hypothetical protein
MKVPLFSGAAFTLAVATGGLAARHPIIALVAFALGLFCQIRAVAAAELVMSEEVLRASRCLDSLLGEVRHV